MTKMEIAQHIADDHNRLANILASGGMKLLNADSAIFVGRYAQRPSCSGTTDFSGYRAGGRGRSPGEREEVRRR